MRKALLIGSVIAGLALVLLGGYALAQTGGGFDLSWNVTAGGGGDASGGVYSVSGTAGQPAIAMVSGGAYELCAGFWCASSATGPPKLFLPIVVRSF